jgi:glycosyltransferase involved in cell wall biosynthesis
MRITILSRFNSTGGGRHAKNFYRALRGAAADDVQVKAVDPDDIEAVARMLVEGEPQDSVIFFFLAHPQLVEKVRGRKILWHVFESDHVPAKVRELLTGYDQIWVPSRWGQEVLIANGIEAAKLRVVPEGVAAELYAPAPRPHRGFIFLSVGKYEKRKAIDEIVQAFGEEFPAAAHADISLWLKADHPLLPERVLELNAKTAGDARIKIIGGDYPERDIIKLYHSADAFLFPSRAEGFGLPCLEALACGLPTVAVNYSGQSEYLREIEGLYYPVDYSLVPIQDRDFEEFFREAYDGEPLGRWAEPDIASLRLGMREMYQNRDDWRVKAARAADILRRQFDWRQVAERGLGFLT